MTKTEEFKEKYSKLPAAVQNLLFSDDLAKMVTTIGNKNGLHVDQIGILNDTVEFAILGDFPRDEFAQKLRIIAELSEEKAQQVTRDINELIFKPMQQVLRENPGTPTTEETPAQVEHPDEILGAISNPSSIPSPTRIIEAPVPPAASNTTPTQITPATPAATQTVAIPVVTNPLPKQSLPHEMKLEESVHIAPKVTDQATARMSSLIPPEVKEKINKDPYKEAI